MHKHLKMALGALLALGAGTRAAAQWSTKPSGTTNGITALKFVDSTKGFACGEFNTLLKTSDGGASWQPLAGSGIPSATFLSIDALSAGNVFVARNGLFVTENGGASWTEWGSWNNSAYSIQSIKAINDSTAFIMKGGTILKTSDKGASWTEVYQFPDLTGPMVFTGGNDTAFVVSGRTWDNVCYGTIHRSTDGGATWNDLGLSGLQITAIHFRNGHAGSYVAFDGTLYRTADGGLTWTSPGSVVTGGADYITGLLFTTEATGYAVGQLGYIYKTADGGAHWSVDREAHRTNGNYDVPLAALAAVGKRYVLAAGNSGTMLRNDGKLSVHGTRYTGPRLYPNPVSDYLTVATGDAADYERLCVYDMAGRMLTAADISGQREVRICMRQYSSGCYLVELTGRAEKHAVRVTVR